VKTDKRVRLLQFLLWLGVIYHAGLGLIGLFGKSLVGAIARNIFGFRLTVTQEILFVIDPLAALMLATGGFLFFCARDPVKYRPLVYVLPGLMAVRLVQMLIFAATPEDLSLMSRSTFFPAVIATAVYGGAVLASALSLHGRAE
jgi:hypothetical protein